MTVRKNRIYRHFKGNYYIVEDIAYDCETTNPMVVYRALYSDGKLWVRSLEEFLSEVDREKYPEANQQFRFQLV